MTKRIGKIMFVLFEAIGSKNNTPMHEHICESSWGDRCNVRACQRHTLDAPFYIHCALSIQNCECDIALSCSAKTDTSFVREFDSFWKTFFRKLTQTHLAAMPHTRRLSTIFTRAHPSLTRIGKCWSASQAVLFVIQMRKNHGIPQKEKI